jgi:hypothetical protein
MAETSKKQITAQIRKDLQASIDDHNFGIGQDDKGNIRTFPASELAARCAERDRNEAAWGMELADDAGADADEYSERLAEKPEGSRAPGKAAPGQHVFIHDRRRR